MMKKTHSKLVPESAFYLLRLKRVVEKFPGIKKIATIFNKVKVRWAIAAGTAVYIYCGGDESSLDDVDIWIGSESKEKVAQILDQKWQSQSSERHKAENITLGKFDIFINCRKYQGNKLLLDYQWTDLVDEQLREAIIDGINYKIVAPEDAVLLKDANPREKDKEDISKLRIFGINEDYFRKRVKECRMSLHIAF